MVGAVIVQNGQVVGQGWHGEWGGPHAEVEALQDAGARARGGTAYVSLEPCNHFGKTPPCSKALMEAGIGRVVYGAADPGEASGGGGARLRTEGVQVQGPILSREDARRENPVFFHPSPDEPWVCLKLAMSLDGGIAVREGERTAITGPEVSARVHWLRAGVDAVLIGARTARVDDPLLTPRGELQPRIPPRRVILDGRGTLSPDLRLFREGEGEVQVLTTSAASEPWLTQMDARGARITVVPGREGRVELKQALTQLRTEGIRSVLCEGGGVLASALLTEELVHRVHLAIAPRFLGQDRVPAFPEVDELPSRNGWNFAFPPEALGADLWLTLDREL